MDKRATRYSSQEGEILLPIIREIADQRSNYGYRRITTLLNNRLQMEGSDIA